MLSSFFVDDENSELADPVWFRPPNRRENAIAAGLFVAFAGFFILLFFVLGGWWFRWVILTLGGVSLLKGLTHARHALHK